MTYPNERITDTWNDHPFSRAFQWAGRPLLKAAINLQAGIMSDRYPYLGDRDEVLAGIEGSMSPEERAETEFACGTLVAAGSIVLGTALGVQLF